MLENVINSIHKIEPRHVKKLDNISKKEKKALTDLKELAKSTIEIKKADKTDTWVVMEKSDYRDKLVIAEHLSSNTYKKAKLNINRKVYNNLTRLVKEKYKYNTSDSEKEVILDEDWKVANFHVLPKIHKCQEILDKIIECKSVYIKMDFPSTLKSRPICGGPVAVTQGASKLLEKILSPLVKHQKSYVKDEWNFVRKFPCHVNRKCKLISCDIVSLYTSIPSELGLKALKYWIDKFRDEIPSRYSTQFILELAEFVLTNNYFLFDGEMYHQLIGVSMGTIFAPPYSCLSVGFLEETILYPVLLPSKFDPDTCNFIIENFFRFMDDGNTLLPEEIDEDQFLALLNSMNQYIQFTIGKPEWTMLDNTIVQKLVFLSLILYLDSNGNLWTDVFYKETNTHEYLRYDSHHPDHVKKNIPYVLAKRIIVFTSKDDVMAKNLNDLRKWLRNCNYPDEIIELGIRNASLQGPAPEPVNKKIVPLISTYYSNFENNLVTEVTKDMLKNTRNERISEAFKDVQFIQAYRQPPNLLRTLTHSTFTLNGNCNLPIGTHKCRDIRCNLCKLYIQMGNSFTMSNGQKWKLKVFANCNSKNAIYYLTCNFCNHMTYIGITDSIRDRSNNHISCCRHGTGDNLFDNHVFNCSIKNKQQSVEPFFKIHIMMVTNDYSKLLDYECKFHSLGYDIMNNHS